MKRHRILSLCLALSTVIATPMIATAEPATTAAPWIHTLAQYPDTLTDVTDVTSKALGYSVPVALIKAPTPGAPTIYLLNGAGGGEDDLNWITQTNLIDFYRDKNVNVVIPMAGAFSYYTDWQTPGNPQGRGAGAWETFLIHELPAHVEPALHASEKRAIIGMSMSATSAANLATRNAGFYTAMASLSGCAETTSVIGRAAVAATLRRGGQTPTAMWGPWWAENSRAHDPTLHAEALKNTTVYLSSGTGIPWFDDTMFAPKFSDMNAVDAALTSAGIMTEGSAIEAVSMLCTLRYSRALNKAGVEHKLNINPVGTHQWAYW
uniref:alpha/beta hydrolase n=1 Tax=Corynebacterium mastitidis TaxID=161890 RepID=UPI0003696578